jgi:hypothetical protein
MRRAKLQRWLQRDQAAASDARGALERANAELVESQTVARELDGAIEAGGAALADRRAQFDRRLQRHAELLEVAESLGVTLKRESHAHNCSLSALDNARLELAHLMRTIESYHDNLKTQELLDAEHENRKLHAVINNEQESLSKARDAVMAKARETEGQITGLTERIGHLNQQVIQTEQKLQTQAMKIPDFGQLRFALDRLLAQSKKRREEMQVEMYHLEEIRDKCRLADMMEIQESLERQAQLRALMPLAQEVKEESQLPAMLEKCMIYRAEIEELLTEPWFVGRAEGEHE